MMRRLGMYSAEIKRDTIDRFFDAARIYGFQEVQFDFRTVCKEQMPSSIDDTITHQVHKAAGDRDMIISAVNGTFNMIHPDKKIREEGVVRFKEIARSCANLHCGLITLCTGSRNSESMWRWHDDNEKPESWSDLLDTAEHLVKIAEQYDVTLGVEPEASNVVNTPEKALQLLQTMQSPRIKIIFDPANLFHVGDALPEKSVHVLEHAFELLHENIVLAHGKDIRAGSNISFTSAGRGIVAFERMLELLDECGYKGGIILHGIHDEAEFPYSVAFMKDILKRKG